MFAEQSNNCFRRMGREREGGGRASGSLSQMTRGEKAEKQGASVKEQQGRLLGLYGDEREIVCIRAAAALPLASGCLNKLLSRAR